MEKLIHYVWKHKMYPAGPLFTTDGQPLEIVDPGLLNANQGPDFFNAKVKIGATMWVGNVEIHERSSQWYEHGHDRDEAYNNVVLHVATQVDAPVMTSDGKQLPQMQISVPETVLRNYHTLLTTDRYPPCYAVVPSLDRMMVSSFLCALQTERLERKMLDIERRVSLAGAVGRMRSS